MARHHLRAVGSQQHVLAIQRRRGDLRGQRLTGRQGAAQILVHRGGLRHALPDYFQFHGVAVHHFARFAQALQQIALTDLCAQTHIADLGLDGLKIDWHHPSACALSNI